MGARRRAGVHMGRASRAGAQRAGRAADGQRQVQAPAVQAGRRSRSQAAAASSSRPMGDGRWGGAHSATGLHSRRAGPSPAAQHPRSVRASNTGHRAPPHCLGRRRLLTHGRVTLPAQTRCKQLSIACVACIILGQHGIRTWQVWSCDCDCDCDCKYHCHCHCDKHSPALRAQPLWRRPPPLDGTMALWHHGTHYGLRATACQDANCCRKRNMDCLRCSLQTARCPIANVLHVSHSSCD